MQEKSSLPPLPPLSVQALSDLQNIEDVVAEALEHLDDFLPSVTSMLHRHNSPKRIERVLRTCLVAHLDVQINYYSSLPQYRATWIPQIIGSSIGALLSMFPVFVDSEPYRGILNGTAAEYIKTRPLNLPKSKNHTTAAVNEQKALRDQYLANFPDEKIKLRDLCWAAGQHYREWRRWLSGQIKTGSTADLAFRRILSSGKRPLEFNKKPRPDGWE